MIVLGIDPGTVRIGYGFIKKQNGQLTHLKSGLLNLPKTNHPHRLVGLEKSLNILIEKFRPEKVGVEKLFFMKNRKTALQVAEARGVILKLITQKTIALQEVSPREIKLAVTGDGGARKEAVAKMVKYFLDLNSKQLVDDVYDALAIAITVA